jgi:hypothetical protein
VLASISHLVQTPLLIRLQPVRAVMLPWFVLVVLIAYGTVRAFRSRHPSWPWLVAAIGTSMLHGGLGTLVVTVAAVILAFSTVTSPSLRSWIMSPVVFGGFSVLIAVAALATGRSSHFVIGAIMLLAISFFSLVPMTSVWRAFGVLACVVSAASISSTIYFRIEPAESTSRPRVDRQYTEMLEWIRQETSKGARFAVEPNSGFFRARSLRASVNQTIPAIVWVDPLQSVEDERIASQVDQIWNYDDLSTKREVLERLASQVGFEYILARESSFLRDEAVFSSGPFFLFRLGEKTPRAVHQSDRNEPD